MDPLEREIGVVLHQFAQELLAEQRHEVKAGSAPNAALSTLLGIVERERTRAAAGILKP
jgi:hypothetical protein